MNKYFIQHRLHTLAQIYTDIKSGFPFFEMKGIKFSHWDFNFAEGHKTQFLLISTEIKATDYRAALSKFFKNINPVASKISLLSQCYSEIFNEPYLVHKEGSEIVFFRYTRKSNAVPLAFNEDSLKALKKLQNRQDINPEFFYYWNDMLNVTGYSAKLILLCSALESLAKSQLGQGMKKNIFLTNVLGEELKEKIWSQQHGVRHRLIHGEYFSETTDQEDYLGQAYLKIIEYFNNVIFEKILIRSVVNPQRHPDSKEGGYYFLKRTNESPSLEFKNLIAGCDNDFYSYLNNFDIISERDIHQKY